MEVKGEVLVPETFNVFINKKYLRERMARTFQWFSICVAPWTFQCGLQVNFKNEKIKILTLYWHTVV